MIRETIVANNPKRFKYIQKKKEDQNKKGMKYKRFGLSLFRTRI